MEYTLTEAAQSVGLSRPTIFRAIKKGALSARREPDKSYRIDASELARVFPLVSLTQNEEMPRHAVKRPETAETPLSSSSEAALMQLELQMVREQLERERQVAVQVRELADRERETFRETVDDLRKRLDRAEERVLALSAPAASQTAQERLSVPLAPAELPRGLSGLLGRLWGR